MLNKVFSIFFKKDKTYWIIPGDMNTSQDELWEKTKALWTSFIRTITKNEYGNYFNRK